VRYCYLHGFASGPASKKARFFQRALEQKGCKLEIPELDQRHFERLTITRQLSAIENLLHLDPACLIGSSMGGYLASLYAAAHNEVSRLVLLAPALDFARLLEKTTPPEKLAAWRETGWLDVFHYSAGTMRRVHYGLLEDARRYPATPDFTQPALLFHGRRDDTVPIRLSEKFAADHPNVRLIALDSDHELVDALDAIAGLAIPFLLEADSAAHLR
jgi:pimeloyl-ACP methyl ester carboxylesterase